MERKVIEKNDSEQKEVLKEYHGVIAMIEGATEMILIEIEIGMTMDMIQGTTIEKNPEGTMIGITIGNPIDLQGIAVIEIVTVAREDDLIVVEMAVIHANTMATVVNEIVVLIKEEDYLLHQDIMIAMIEKIMATEGIRLMKGEFDFRLQYL